VCKLEQSNLI